MSALENSIATFLAAKSTRSRSTQKFYKSVLSDFQQFRPDGWPPETETIVAWLDSLRERGLSKNSIAGYYRAVRAFVLWLITQEEISHNPLAKIDAPRPKKQKLPRAPARETVASLFEEIESEVALALRRGKLSREWLLTRDLAILSFMVGSGARVRETAWLAVEDIDLRNQLATMRQTKTDQQREVGFSDKVSSDLRLWLGIREHICDLPFVWVSYHRGAYRRLTSDGIRQMLDARTERYNLPRVTPHQLRHYWANYQVNSKASIYDISQQLGHASIKTTEIYFYSAAQERQERLNDTAPR